MCSYYQNCKMAEKCSATEIAVEKDIDLNCTHYQRDCVIVVCYNLISETPEIRTLYKGQPLIKDNLL